MRYRAGGRAGGGGSQGKMERSMEAFAFGGWREEKRPSRSQQSNSYRLGEKQKNVVSLKLGSQGPGRRPAQ